MPTRPPRAGWARRAHAARGGWARSRADVDGLAIRALVGAHMLVEIDEERRVRVELSLQAPVRDLLVQGIEAEEGRRVVQAAHVQLGSSRVEGQAAPLGPDDDARPAVHRTDAADGDVSGAAQEVGAFVAPLQRAGAEILYRLR